MSRFVVDLETNGLYNEVTKIHCIVFKDLHNAIVGTACDEGAIKHAITLLKEADEIIGHNFVDYDMRVIEKLYGIKLDINKITDTLILSYMLHPHHTRHPDCPASKETINGRRNIGPHSLENWAYFLDRGKKIEYENWDVFSKDMLNRCKSDVEITEALYKSFVGSI